MRSWFKTSPSGARCHGLGDPGRAGEFLTALTLALQLRCDLSDRRRIELIAALYELVDHASDQVLVIDLGPVDGRVSACVSSIGRAYANPERTVVIV